MFKGMIRVSSALHAQHIVAGAAQFRSVGRLVQTLTLHPPNENMCRTVVARCGIIGIFGRDRRIAGDLYEGLLMLQHRGQDSAGMVTTDWDHFVEHKGNGLVRDVFKDDNLMNSLNGT